MTLGTNPVSGKLETVTPELASKYLKEKSMNRKLHPARVLDYAIDMETGKWTINGEPVIFNDKGQMIDGQHRMEACLLARKPFITMVVRGIAAENAFSTIDTGENRKVGDILSIAGVADANVVAAVASILYYHKKGMLRAMPGPDRTRRVSQMVRDGKGRLSNGKKIAVRDATHSIKREEVLAFVKNDGLEHRIQDAISEMRKLHPDAVMTISNAAACYLLFSEKDRADAYTFMRNVLDGGGLASMSPEKALRDKLMVARKSTAKLSRWAVVLLVFKAWNMHRNGERAKYIRLQDDEKFPKLI